MDQDPFQEIDRIITDRRLTSVFQPVVSLEEARVFGYEALIRGPGDSPLHSPLSLFECAHQHGLTCVLESACCSTCLDHFHHHDGVGKLFLNVSPPTLVNHAGLGAIIDLLAGDRGIPPSRVVIEITEQYPLENYAAISKATRHFRELGVEIAIDDLGAGYSGLRTWSELRPHYVKIDRHFIENIDEDSVKREFVRSIGKIARELNCRVIAEGIETAGELSTVMSLDIPFGQGYYLGRPVAVPEASSRVEARLGYAERRHAPREANSQTVGEMVLIMPTVSGDTPLDDAVDLFHGDRQLSCLPVVDDEGAVQGIVKRQDILELMAARYSRELHGKKPITQFMDSAPVCVAQDQTLEEASQRLTNDVQSELIQDFVILRDGRYLGIGKTTILLRRITEQQIQYARYANPLTRLPGNPPIHEHLNGVLGRRTPVQVAYVDLNHFKPYNDYYGYDAGDRIIVTVARLLREAVDAEQDFLGHVGGDDFIVIFQSLDWYERCEQVLDAFAGLAASFYDDQAAARGGIAGCNRRGEEEFFELISLAIGVVQPDPVHCVSSHDVARLAADAKQMAKSQPGNRLFVSRRRRPSAMSFNPVG